MATCGIARHALGAAAYARKIRRARRRFVRRDTIRRVGNDPAGFTVAPARTRANSGAPKIRPQARKFRRKCAATTPVPDSCGRPRGQARGGSKSLGRTTTDTATRQSGIVLAIELLVMEFRRGDDERWAQRPEGGAHDRTGRADTGDETSYSRVSSTRLRRGKAPTILIADDDDAVRMLIRACLEAQGYRVVEATERRPGARAVHPARAFAGDARRRHAEARRVRCLPPAPPHARSPVRPRRS